MQSIRWVFGVVAVSRVATKSNPRRQPGVKKKEVPLLGNPYRPSMVLCV